MQIFISVLSALLSARIIEWVAVAAVRTLKERYDLKLIQKVEQIKRNLQQ